MKNKLRLILLLFIFTFLNFYCQSITPYPHNKRYLVAVLQIENKTDNHIPKDTLDSVQLQITNGLVSYKRIRLLERDRIDAILKEQKLSQLGIIDGNEAIKVGKLLGADAVLIGEISGIKKDFNEIEAPLTKNTFLNLELSLSCRIIHVTTGEILASALVKEDENSNEITSAYSRVGKIDIDLMIKKDLDKASEKIVRELSYQIPQK